MPQLTGNSPPKGSPSQLRTALTRRTQSQAELHWPPRGSHPSTGCSSWEPAQLPCAPLQTRLLASVSLGFCKLHIPAPCHTSRLYFHNWHHPVTQNTPPGEVPPQVRPSPVLLRGLFVKPQVGLTPDLLELQNVYSLSQCPQLPCFSLLDTTKPPP